MEVLGIGGSSEQDPAPEEPPPNLVLYMYLRIFSYSSNIFMTSLAPMTSILTSWTWKNSRFFRRSSSLRDRDPTMKLICSTHHPWCCNVSPRVLRRDTYWFSVWDLVRMRYWSVTSLILLNSRIKKMTVFVSVGGRNLELYDIRS